MRSCHGLAGIPDKKYPLRGAHLEANDVGVTTAMVAKQRITKPISRAIFSSPSLLWCRGYWQCSWPGNLHRLLIEGVTHEPQGNTDGLAGQYQR
jgi:hypothetical protein